MSLNLQYIGSFQQGVKIQTENPLEEVWSYLERWGLFESLKLLTPIKPNKNWSKHVSFANVRIRQAVELRRSSKGMSLLSRPIPLYYSFLNLLRAYMAIAPEKIGKQTHGLIYKDNSKIFQNAAKISPVLGVRLELNSKQKRAQKLVQVCCCTILASIVQYKKISVMDLNSSQHLFLRPRSLIVTLKGRLD